MGKGLQRHAVPVFVSGGLDNRTDPKLVAPGAVVLADECYYAQTGALTKRNATTAVTSNWADQNGNSGAMNAIQDAFLVQGGHPALIASGTGGLYRELLGFSDSAGKWMRTRSGALPSVITSIEGIEAASNNSATSNDMTDPDLCVANNAGNKTVLMCWTDNGGAGTANTELRDAASGVPREIQHSLSPSLRARCAAVGKYACAFGISALGTVRSIVYDTSTTAAAINTSFGIIAAAPFHLEAMPRPGGSTIIVAVSAAAGVTLLEFNPATNAIVAGPVNIAAVDATQCIGLLDDTQSSGSYWLASVGTTAGAVVRQLTTAFAVTATRVIDNTTSLTSGVRNITGYLSSSTEFVVFFDGSAGASYQGWIVKGTWIAGIAATAVWQRGAALLSKAFKYDGIYYLVANYMASAANIQETQVVLADPVVPFGGAGGNLTSSAIAGIQLPLVGGGKTNKVSCLASVYALDSANFLFGTLRKTALTATNGTFLTTRSVVKASMAMTTVRRRPREIGGITYIPGGLLSLYDGVSWKFPAFAAFPEIPTAITPGGGGSMTSSGQYDYVAVYRDVDASGRVYRSAASPVVSVTLGAGDTSAQVVVTTLRLDRGTPFSTATSAAIELYRRGPAAAGATNFNRVAVTGSILGGPGGDSTTFTDTVSDAVANTGETLYDTGGVLDNFSPPSSNLMETWNGRVFLVDPEYPTRIWFSKQLKPGLGLAFNPLLTLLCEGDSGGPITALCAMDHYLVIFKRSSILVVTGDGPNDANQGQFSQAQIVTTATGTTDPGSVCLTPDGVMFHDYRQGFMLLTRGLSLDPVGYPVAANGGVNNNGVSDSALVPTLGQARFLSVATGRVFVWHYVLKKWTRIATQTGGSGLALVSIPGLEVTAAGGALYEAGSTGAIRFESLGLNVGPDSSGSYQQQIMLPRLSFDSIGGFSRAYGAHIAGTTLVASNSLTVYIDYDEESAFTETHQINVSTLADQKFAFEVQFSRQKCQYVQMLIVGDAASAFSLTGVRFVIGTKGGRGMFPVATTQRIPPQ